MTTSSPTDSASYVRPSEAPLTTREIRKRQILQRIADVRTELYALERELSCVEVGVAAPYRFDREVPSWLRRDNAKPDREDDRRGS